MAGFRAYYDFAGKGAPERAVLCAEESRHLCGSLRARAGDLVTLFDLDGGLCEARIEAASQKAAELAVLKNLERPKTAAGAHLAMCLPNAGVFDSVLRQSVELGARGVFPLLSENSQVRLDAAEAERKLPKWSAKVIEAVKQSANFSPFELGKAAKLEAFLSAAAGGFVHKFVASLRGNSRPALETMLGEIKSADETACILIGPEGDLSEREYGLAEAAGFIPVSLGASVMKCDTAACCALSLANACLTSAPRAT